MDFLGREFSDVLGIQVHSGSDSGHLNPGMLEVAQQAAKWFRRVARNCCTGTDCGVTHAASVAHALP